MNKIYKLKFDKHTTIVEVQKLNKINIETKI